MSLTLNASQLGYLKSLAARGDTVARGLLDAMASEVAAGAEKIVTLLNPAAKAVSDVAAALAGNSAENAFVIAASPDMPRNLRVTFAAEWDGGKVVVTGVDQFGKAVTEEFTANPGNTVVGAKIFKTVTGATKASVGANVAAATIGTGDKLACGTAKLANAFASLLTDGAAEAATIDATYSAFTPTTAPDGAHDYQILVRV